MTPSDPSRPPRPQRRFSAMRPPRGAKPAEAAPETLAAAAAASSSAEPGKKASDEARIAKVMARAGLCSRRDAEGWIRDGRVAVNGVTIDSPALNVGPGDAVAVDGYPIDKPERTRLFLFNKARGLVTTARDPEGRPTVFDALPDDLPRLVTIGRLDINTEGLLLLTNDGGLARLLELPATGWIRRYRVRANGTTDQARLDALAKGITIDGVAYAGIAAKLDRVQGANLWLTMGLKEGKNREIKRVLEHLGLAVTRLIRISFGPFQLGELGDNAVEEVRTRVLRDQLGTALAKQAGVDFDGPVGEDRVAEPVATPARRQRPGAEAAVPEGPRRQTRRSATADRRGRAVTVERITASAPKAQDRPVRRERTQAGASHGSPGAKQRPRASDDRPSRQRDDGASRKSARSGDERRSRDDRSQGADRVATAGRGAPARSRDDRPSRPGDERRPNPTRAPKGERFAAADRTKGERPQRSRSRDDERGGGARPARPGTSGKPGGRPGVGPPGGGHPRGGKGRPPRG